MPKLSPLHREVLAAHRERLAGLIDRSYPARLKKLYDKAQDEVAAKLARAVRGGRRDSFTAQQHRIVLSQIRQGQAQVAHRMTGALGDASAQVQHAALRGLISDVRKLEAHFRGLPAGPLPIEEAATFSGVIKGRAASLLDQHATSMGRYGARVVRGMREQMSIGLMAGESTGDVVDRVREVADLEWWQADRIVRCLPGEACITGAVVRAATRRWYDGDIIDVITKGGQKLTATANHPMLTRRGWISQGSVMPGDDLIRHCWEKDARSAGDQHVAASPPTICEVFDALAAVGVVERRRGRKPDFHGEGGEGDVEIARFDGKLVYGVLPTLTEPTSQHLFTPANGSDHRFCPRCMRLLPCDRACLCAPAARHAEALQAALDHAAVGIVPLRQIDNALQREVAGFYLCLGKYDFGLGAIAARHACMMSFLEGARDPRSLNPPLYTVPADAEAERNLPSAQSGEVKLDRVVGTFRRRFSGHVFNLITTNGYFATNGFYTGNTELAWTASATQADGIAASAQALPDLRMRWSELCDDETGEPLDDRVAVDSIAMHGQCALPGQVFRMPATAPFPDADGNTKVPAALVGKSWLFPPNRPNDRSSIQPWRPGWGIPGWRYAGGRRVRL